MTVGDYDLLIEALGELPVQTRGRFEAASRLYGVLWAARQQARARELDIRPPVPVPDDDFLRDIGIRA
jgi:hypothetical protein